VTEIRDLIGAISLELEVLKKMVNFNSEIIRFK
jgi:hypothetical protein